jgi:general L-amino acid transport system substrate-binding protein
MLKLAIAAALTSAFVGSAFAGKTLDTIKQRGQLVCGVNPSLPGFSAADSQGNWAGLDVDPAVYAGPLRERAGARHFP